MNSEALLVLSNIIDIAKSIRYNGKKLNERYLHHYFSHKMQDSHKLLSTAENNINITLHPEWPTFKKATGLPYGKYKRRNNKYYYPHQKGTAGFIDFAIGDYYKPYIGIEFLLKYGWAHEEVIFDFLKLMDGRNPFKVGISFNIIFREKDLVKGGYLKDLSEHMNNAIYEAIKRLGKNVFDNKRKLYFIITEISKDNKRRHWHYKSAIKKFVDGLPTKPS